MKDLQCKRYQAMMKRRSEEQLLIEKAKIDASQVFEKKETAMAQSATDLKKQAESKAIHAF
jgi:hypothetical protein